jgi:hypothetical protein
VAIKGVPDDISAILARLGGHLDRRRKEHVSLLRYRDGGSPIPAAVSRARVTKAYRMLMPMAEAPWADLVVGSTMDRLEINGVNDPDNKQLADKAWGLWQENAMDNESKIAHDTILTDGRACALVWKEPGEDSAEIYLDSMATTIVEYAPGSRRRRTAAMRYWIDGTTPYANIYTDTGIYKFKGPPNSASPLGTQWERYQPEGDQEWPVTHELGEVPVVEIGINRRLKPGRYPFARGEYEHCLGLIDRINLLTFLGLVVAFWMGFPLRGVIGQRVLKDDNGDVIPPFDSTAGGIFQLENPEAKLGEFAAADRSNLSVFSELAQLAMITKTPRHYFPMEGGLVNLSADAIRASEGALHAKVANYQPQLGEGWIDVMRLQTKWEGDGVLSPRASIQWADKESRSLAERADAASKLKDILPGVAIAERIMGFSRDDWRGWQSETSGNAITNLMQQVANGSQPVTIQVGHSQPNGKGAPGLPTGQPDGKPTS